MTPELQKQIERAIEDGELHYCPNCKEKQPIELTHFDPDEEGEPDLIRCLICQEGIGFIDAM